ncbi:MAG: hypothetical protein KGK44_09505 [Gammaproteobacteria bacterium]|nr:hypothetical protein [Gammaproteobacteria bacterium]
MASTNPEIDYVSELLKLRKTYVSAQPQSRLNVIRKRLANNEVGPTKLVTVVSAVEALARSLIIHGNAKTSEAVDRAYAQVKLKDADTLVEDYLRQLGQPKPTDFFVGETWLLFRNAVNFRNLVVHECTYLGQDKYPSLINAGLEVLENLVRLGGLRTARSA